MAKEIREMCLRAATDDWLEPTGEEVREILRMIASRKGISQFSGGMASKYLGLTGQGDRTLRRWTSGAVPIPYAAWALLCDAAGFEPFWRQVAPVE